ncbi:MAG TPA: hypothetical protein VNO79_04770 [Actinomycetota bacterium]|nr:hypothetical protein [Actinomycetota bacterium]
MGGHRIAGGPSGEPDRPGEPAWEDVLDWLRDLREDALESILRLSPRVWFSFPGVVRRVRLLSPEELDPSLDDAVARHAISDDEAEHVRMADLLLAGRSAPEGEPVFLVVEVAFQVDRADVEHAVARADILSRVGHRALAAVAGIRVTADGDEAARSRGVWRVIDRKTYPPGQPVRAGAA